MACIAERYHLYRCKWSLFLSSWTTLTAGFAKIICRGILYTSRNADIVVLFTNLIQPKEQDIKICTPDRKIVQYVVSILINTNKSFAHVFRTLYGSVRESVYQRCMLCQSCIILSCQSTGRICVSVETHVDAERHYCRHWWWWWWSLWIQRAVD